MYRNEDDRYLFISNFAQLLFRIFKNYWTKLTTD